MQQQQGRFQPKRKKNKLFLPILSIVLIGGGLIAALLISKGGFDFRRQASERTVRSGWLGLAVDWDQIEVAPDKVSAQLGDFAQPWIYDWKTEYDRYDKFGDSFSPMIWGCSNEVDFANTLDKALAWPKSNSYLLFLNEPDDSHNICEPELAAQRLNLLLNNSKRKPEMKIIIAAGVNGPGWLTKMLTEYRSRYGTNPAIDGIHVHIYTWPTPGFGLKDATPEQLLASGKKQLETWRSFTTTQEPWLANKEFWLSETGVLGGETPELVMSQFMVEWLAHLESQSYVNRAFWFVNNVQSSRPFTWQNRAGALYRDMQPTILAQTFKSECAKYCPGAQTPTPPVVVEPLPVTDPATSAFNPLGYHDFASCGRSQGWVCDHDNLQKEIVIHMYKNVGKPDQKFLGETLANQACGAGQDCINLTGACGNYKEGYRRFYFAITPEMGVNPGDTVDAMAINIDSQGNKTGSNGWLTNQTQVYHMNGCQ